jgi:carbamoyl-phosphate synthase large subunit
MLDVGLKGFVCNDLKFVDLDKELSQPTDKRIFAIAVALQKGYSVEKIHQLTKITPWFLYKMKSIIETEMKLRNLRGFQDLGGLISKELMKEAKKNGFSDLQIAELIHSTENEVREKRKSLGVLPVVKQIDTMAAEYPAQTNYLYLTYHGNEHDISVNEKNLPSGQAGQIAVIGSGAYRIGSSVEFDWCCVTAVQAVNSAGCKSIMINCNPETVSTDYDICDKLYFEQLTLERVLDICDLENPEGVIVSMGGQVPNNLAMKLHNAGVKIIGTSPIQIDNAESRHKFSQILDKLEIDQPEWTEVTTISEAKKFSAKVGYPVLIRPSYVLSGAAMSIVLTEDELEVYLKKATDLNHEHPVVISKFITDAREIEIDAVADHGELFCYAIAEHVENAGVHSGDATIVLPPQRTYLETMRRVKNITRKIASEFEITGPFNIQFIAKDNDVKVIECNFVHQEVFRSFLKL